MSGSQVVGCGSVPLMAWAAQSAGWPGQGRCLLAAHDAGSVVVYQAFDPVIAEYAVRRQRFGGAFSLDRMSWIKPGFLWMMSRSGWATKPGQQRILAVRLPRTGFDAVLGAAVPSAFDPNRYRDHTAWQAAVKASDVRVQWDPDHDPHGRPQPRRVIQLGLRGNTLRRYAADWPEEILDVTEFVTAQHALVRQDRLDEVRTPVETPYPWTQDQT